MKTKLLLVLMAGMVTIMSYSQSRFISRETDSLIVSAIAMISADTLVSDMQALQDFGTRFMLDTNRKEVATWIKDRFLSFGIEEVRLDSFQSHIHVNYPPYLIFDTTTWQYNVEARIEGISVPEQEILILGHYDDAPILTTPWENVPGADDNASGTSAVLECARVISLMDYQPEQTMIFLASAAEELMYFGDGGTEHYAAQALENGRNIVMAINNDMIAWDVGIWTLDLYNHINSPHITDLAIDIIENYTTLDYKLWTPVEHIGGDIQPFLDAGYHGIYFMENYINSNYHLPTDVVDSCDIPYFVEVVKVNMGCLLKYDLTVGMADLETGIVEFRVYPNPASDQVTFYMGGEGNNYWELCLVNSYGIEVYRNKLQSGNHTIDIGFLEAGVYLLSINNGKEVSQKKLIISK